MTKMVIGLLTFGFVWGAMGAQATPVSIAGVSYDAAAPIGSVTKPLFDTKNPPKGARNFHVTYKGAGNKEVPGLLMVPGDGRKVQKYPVVLLVHGISGRKEDLYLLGVAFARRGYATLAIDLPAHGERRLSGGKKLSDLTLNDTRRIGATAVVDLRRAVDYLAARADLDKTRVGCVGVSLGGIFSGVFAGVEPRLGAVVLWLAGGDWGKLLTQSQQATALVRREKGTILDAAAIEATLKDIDPINYINHLAPRPLLILAGTEDTIVPNVCTDELFAAARNPKKLVRYPGGHIPDARAMTVSSVDFIDATFKKKLTRTAISH